MRVDVRLLGPLDVQYAGSAVPLRAPKERMILMLLAFHRGHVVPVERLVDVVWGEAPPKSGIVSVRVLVSRLRNTFAAAGHSDVIRRCRPDTYWLPIK